MSRAWVTIKDLIYKTVCYLAVSCCITFVIEVLYGHTYIHVNGSAVVIIRMHYTTQDAYYETACIDKFMHSHNSNAACLIASLLEHFRTHYSFLHECLRMNILALSPSGGAQPSNYLQQVWWPHTFGCLVPPDHCQNNSWNLW